MAYTGELAALATSVCFSFGSTLFTLAGRAYESSALVNRTRLVLALGCVLALHLLLTGTLLPLAAGPAPWLWLAASGLVGLALGDTFLFQAFVLVGPRLAMLMMALAPVLGGLLAWVFLGEVLAAADVAGIAVVVAGIMLVVSDRAGQPLATAGGASPRVYIIGLLCGLGGAAGQAGGLVLSKIGLSYGLEPLSGNAIRLLAATAAVWLVTLVSGRARGTVHRLRQHPRAFAQMCLATLLGPVVGVWLNLVAVRAAPVGVAATLSSLMPILLIPISAVVFKERITGRAVAGTLLALAGTTLFFL
ncbi:MAG: DMT family transporter [Anaerolineae bacterium]|nr:DMT family transporter [Anaerolineae bacterium]